MPKGKRKGRSDRNRTDRSQSSDDESNNDNISVVSYVSENRSGEENEDSENLAQDQIEEKLCETIDGLTQKSSQGRTNCFQELTLNFVKKYMPGFVKERYFTICDSIERSLKKGGGPEKSAAADLATITILQLGEEDASEEVYRLLKPVLLTTICDNSVAASVKAKCCTTLSDMTFLSGGEIGEIMQLFESIFAASYLKGDGSVPSVTPDMAILHAAAIQAWSLLFTLIAPGNFSAMINNSKSLPSLQKLSELLESAHLDVRTAAGETLALIFELGRDESEDFEEDFALDISETLRRLATDSHKYRAKKDRKLQRAAFRDILQFFENDIVPEAQVKFGKEVLILDTWTRRKQYESLCNILGPSINVHLTENDFLRDIFEIISQSPVSEIPAHAQNQMERSRKRLLNAANFKSRTISRGKNRDKRSDF